MTWAKAQYVHPSIINGSPITAIWWSNVPWKTRAYYLLIRFLLKLFDVHSQPYSLQQKLKTKQQSTKFNITIMQAKFLLLYLWICTQNKTKAARLEDMTFRRWTWDSQQHQFKPPIQNSEIKINHILTNFQDRDNESVLFNILGRDLLHWALA